MAPRALRPRLTGPAHNLHPDIAAVGECSAAARISLRQAHSRFPGRRMCRQSVRPVGFEPTTCGLRVRCSAVELEALLWGLPAMLASQSLLIVRPALDLP